MWLWEGGCLLPSASQNQGCLVNTACLPLVCFGSVTPGFSKISQLGALLDLSEQLTLPGTSLARAAHLFRAENLKRLALSSVALWAGFTWAELRVSGRSLVLSCRDYWGLLPGFLSYTVQVLTFH